MLNQAQIFGCDETFIFTLLSAMVKKMNFRAEINNKSKLETDFQ